MQRALFDAWGQWRQATLDEPADQIHFHQAARRPGRTHRLRSLVQRANLPPTPAPVCWSLRRTQPTRRGEIERAFLKHTGPAAHPLFEFSLGVPLSRVALPKSAHLLLRWLSGPLAEHELDWLLSTGHAPPAHRKIPRCKRTCARSAAEAWNSPLDPEQLYRTKRRGRSCRPPGSPACARPNASWQSLRAARKALSNGPNSPRGCLRPPAGRVRSRCRAPNSRPSAAGSRPSKPAARWASMAAAFPGPNSSPSWPAPWTKPSLPPSPATRPSRSPAPPSRQASPPMPSGSSARTRTPGRAGGSTHPLLPLEVQREANMPHATAQLDWDLAECHHRPPACLRAGGPLQLCAAK